MKNLGILLSGRGSNFVAIADNIAAGKLPGTQIAIVISNRADAPGLEAARRRGLNALLIASKGKAREQHDQEVVAALKSAHVDLVVLAGYMRLLSPGSCNNSRNASLISIHPCFRPFPALTLRSRLSTTA